MSANRQQIERCIDELAELARTAVEPGRFFAEVLSRLRQTRGIVQARLWSPSASGGWVVAHSSPGDFPPATTGIPDETELLEEAARAQQPYSQAVSGVADRDGRRIVRTICPVIHAGRTVGLIDTFHDAGGARESGQEVIPFLRALGEVTGDFLAQVELQQLRQARSQWQEWDQFTQRLMRANELRDVAATIANDGRLVAGSDRLTLLRRVGSRYRVLAMTGVEQVDSRSATVLSLESIAGLVAGGRQSVWVGTQSAAEPAETPVIAALIEFMGVTGSRAIGVVPLPMVHSSADPVSTVGEGVLVVEQFQDVPDLNGWSSRHELLSRRCEPLLMAAFERDGVPFLQVLQRWRRAPGWLQRPSLRLAGLLLLLAAAVLTVIPAEFTVTGPAELVPDHRREVFASSSGVVDQLLVQHGEDVQANQPLIILHDPRLSLELPRVVGEIDVIRERLKGVQAARLAGGAAVDSANRARQLTAEEEELKERQRSLGRQRELIEQQLAALTLRSPIRGKVLTWDLATQLAARPVERGQALLTIGDTEGPWVVEMRIADKDFGHVRRARRRLRPGLDVEFLLAADPGHSYRGTIRDVAQVAQADDQLVSSVFVTIATDRQQFANVHAGTTAIPRIHCGRQALGYVWLHDLLDAIRTRVLF